MGQFGRDTHNGNVNTEMEGEEEGKGSCLLRCGATRTGWPLILSMWSFAHGLRSVVVGFICTVLVTMAARRSYG